MILLLGLETYCQDTKTPQWQLQFSGVTSSIRGASAVNADVCWLGTQGGLIRTTDGGANWHKINIPGADSLDFRDVQAFGDQECIAMSAGSGGASRIYKTLDGGATWKLVKQNTHENGFYNGMAFWGENTGVLAGDPVYSTLYILKTTDGGDTWREIDPDKLPLLQGGEYGFAASGTHIAVQGSDKAFVGTGGSVARIFYSDDQGESWKVADTPMISGASSQGTFSVAFQNKEYGMAVGGDYTKEQEGHDNMIVSYDGGKTWQLTVGVDLDFRSCIAFVGSKVIAVGPSGSEISFDGGRSFVSLGNMGFHTLTVSPDGEGVWAAGAGGVVGRLE
ncbi:putative oxidoreductase [Fulvivirga imtechensis AK7]|uniref:Putative oxidoreductase n=2 Tax=Fulvivirga TaxID=396811 RepID=L8JJB1_9BACT|nr:putative oxidoreductase [Fulvivirga imtechensis AK7]